MHNNRYVMTGAGSELTLKVLGTIEGLLLLKEESVADKRQSANGLAVSSMRQLSAPL